MNKFIFLLFIHSISSCSQNKLPKDNIPKDNIPKDYFRPPLDIPMELSGCFGELRPNHFHSGFDIKTNKKEGLKVYAVADGYISRIKISSFGYGKAIYVTHPNGYTTLYGHLSSGFGKIEAFIKTNQYNLQAYEIELFLKPQDLPVSKGDVIALSGNTGGSGGPHLHFEFRDSKTENIINPMLFGYNKYVKDTTKPTITSLFVYPINEKSVVNQSNKPVAINLIMQQDGNYLAQKIKASGKIGFGIGTFDSFDNSYNKYGVYEVGVFNNGKSIFDYKFDTFSFEAFRYINALLDYTKLKLTNQKIQRLFMKNPYPLTVISTNETNGVLNIGTENMSQVYKIQVADFNHNIRQVLIPIDYSEDIANNIIEVKKSKYLVKCNNENIFSLSNAEVVFPEKIFYEDFYMDFNVINDTVYLHNDTVPVHNNFTLSIESTKYSEQEMQKMFIGKYENKQTTYIPTTRKGNLFSIKNKELGVFCLAKDVIAPKISISKPIEGLNLSKSKNIQLKISDDFSGIKSYNGYLNGKWVLMEYEHKLKKLIYNFEDKMTIQGKNIFKLEVIDNVGNSATFETWFDFYTN